MSTGITVALDPVQESSLSHAESRLDRHFLPRDLNCTIDTRLVSTTSTYPTAKRMQNFQRQIV